VWHEDSTRSRELRSVENARELHREAFLSCDLDLFGVTQRWSGARSLGRYETVVVSPRGGSTQERERLELRELVHGSLATPGDALLLVEVSNHPLEELANYELGVSSTLPPVVRRLLTESGHARRERFHIGGSEKVLHGIGVRGTFVVRGEMDARTITICAHQWTATRVLERVYDLSTYIAGRDQIDTHFGTEPP